MIRVLIINFATEMSSQTRGLIYIVKQFLEAIKISLENVSNYTIKTEFKIGCYLQCVFC